MKSINLSIYILACVILITFIFSCQVENRGDVVSAFAYVRTDQQIDSISESYRQRNVIDSIKVYDPVKMDSVKIGVIRTVIDTTKIFHDTVTIKFRNWSVNADSFSWEFPKDTFSSLDTASIYRKFFISDTLDNKLKEFSYSVRLIAIRRFGDKLDRFSDYDDAIQKVIIKQ